MDLRQHLAQPDISIEAHIAARGAALAASLEGRLPLYLDTRFWIMVREVRDGTSVRPDEREIVRLIEALVAERRIFCPIAEPTFLELMRQGNDAQRQATAHAIDTLSAGVAILPHDERMVAEAERLLRGWLVDGARPPLLPAWTSLAYVLGEIYPAATPFAPDIERGIQKAFFDHLWTRPIAEVAAALDPDTFTEIEEQRRIAATLSADNERHRADMRSFDRVLDQEFRGVAAVIAARSVRLATLFGPEAAAQPAATRVAAAGLRELLKRDQDARRLPTAHVHAVIHALLRWEHRDRAITANDLVDFRHAAAALGHCRAFLTEATLCGLLHHRRLPLAPLHGVRVLSDRAEIVVYLQGVAAGGAD